MGVVYGLLAAAAGAAFRDNPTAFGALALLAAVVVPPLLLHELAAHALLGLDAVSVEREALRAELDAAHRTEEEFRVLAHHDALTGLPNRNLLYDRLSVAITRSHRQGSHVALLFLDLDDFKTVNDSLGHCSGDRLLVDFATRLGRVVRAGDTVARFGGDEFVVLLDDVTGSRDATRVAAKVLDAVQAPYRLDDDEVSIAASVGVSVYPADGTSPADLLRTADTAMYRDKQRAARPQADTQSPPPSASVLSPGLAPRQGPETTPCGTRRPLEPKRGLDLASSPLKESER